MNRISYPVLAWMAFSSFALAAPLQSEHVSADAKWVVHIDFETLRDTSLAEKLREDQPQAVGKAIEWLQKEYGIHPREDLKGLTAFSDTYEEHTGVVILYAAYDRDKVQAKIGTQAAAETKWQDYTLYTWNVQDHKGGNRQVSVVLVDGTKAVFASSPERAKAAVTLLGDEDSSLAGKSSPLAAAVSTNAVPEGAAMYGAAIDLGQIARQEHFFPILRQHERVVWAFGEREGELFETATFVGQSEEVAMEVEEVLHGATALVKLWANGQENLTRIADATKINRDGKTVKVSWQTDATTVLDAIEEFKQQVQKTRP